VKKLLVVSVAALMLASSVFAPVAMAQEPGDVDIQSVTVDGGRWTVNGTIQCTQGDEYDLLFELFVDFDVVKLNKFLEKDFERYQKRLDKIIESEPGFSVVRVVVLDVPCETTGPQSFTLGPFSLGPTKNSKVWVAAVGQVCSSPFSCNQGEALVERVKLR
jgi:hypothetical protein